MAGALGFVLLDLAAQLGEEWLADTVVFVGSIVDNAVLVDVKDGAEEEFGLMEGVGEVGDIGEKAVGHADDVVDAEAGLLGEVGVAAVVEVFFVGVEVAGGGVGMEAGFVRGGVEIAAEEGVICRSEAEALGGGNGFREEDALEEGGHVGEREVVGGGEIVGFGDNAGAGLVGAAFEDAAKGAAIDDGIVLGGLLVEGIALGSEEANGIGVAVGGSIAGGKAAGDAGVGVTELGEAVVERTLAEKFVEAVVSEVVANEEHAFDVVADGGGAVGISEGGERDGSLAAPSGASGHDSAAGDAGVVKVVELFEGEGDDGEFDQAGWVEVLARVEVIGVGGEGGAVLGVAVDLGVNVLELGLGVVGDAL